MHHPHGKLVQAGHLLTLVCQHRVWCACNPGMRAAAGSGYLTAAMAKLVQPGGFVLGVEKVPELVQHAKGCISRGKQPAHPSISNSRLHAVVGQLSRHGLMLSTTIDCQPRQVRKESRPVECQLLTCSSSYQVPNLSKFGFACNKTWHVLTG